MTAISEGRDSCQEDDFSSAMVKVREKRDSGVESPDELYG